MQFDSNIDPDVVLDVADANVKFPPLEISETPIPVVRKHKRQYRLRTPKHKTRKGQNNPSGEDTGALSGELAVPNIDAATVPTNTTGEEAKTAETGEITGTVLAPPAAEPGEITEIILAPPVIAPTDPITAEAGEIQENISKQPETTKDNEDETGTEDEDSEEEVVEVPVISDDKDNLQDDDDEDDDVDVLQDDHPPLRRTTRASKKPTRLSMMIRALHILTMAAVTSAMVIPFGEPFTQNLDMRNTPRYRKEQAKWEPRIQDRVVIEDVMLADGLLNYPLERARLRQLQAIDAMEDELDEDMAFKPEIVLGHRISKQERRFPKISSRCQTLKTKFRKLFLFDMSVCV